MYTPFDIAANDKQRVTGREDPEDDDGDDSSWKVFRLAPPPSRYFALDPKLCPNTNPFPSSFFKARLSWNPSKLTLFKTIIYQIHFKNCVNSSNSMIISILFCLTHFVFCYCGRVEGSSRCELRHSLAFRTLSIQLYKQWLLTLGISKIISYFPTGIRGIKSNLGRLWLCRPELRDFSGNDRTVLK